MHSPKITTVTGPVPFQMHIFLLEYYQKKQMTLVVIHTFYKKEAFVHLLVFELKDLFSILGHMCILFLAEIRLSCPSSKFNHSLF